MIDKHVSCERDNVRPSVILRQGKTKNTRDETANKHSH